MSINIDEIKDNFIKAYPNDLILVYKFTIPGGGRCYGIKLLNVRLHDGDWLHVYKLEDSLGSQVTSDEIKSKAFPFVFDTKSETNDKIRCDSLRASLMNIFPNHHVNVFIFNETWSRSSRDKGAASFMNEYGSDVSIVLS